MEDIIAHWNAQNVVFIAIPSSEQLFYKENRSKPDLDLQQKDGGSIRKFNRKWYETYPWLTGSSSLNKLFCLVCAVYGGDPSWAQDGIDMIKNFTNKAEKHQASKRHIKNMETFIMIGKARRVREKEKLLSEDVKKIKEEEFQRRQILAQIINGIFFLMKRKMGGRGSDEVERKCLEGLIMRNYVNNTSFAQIYSNVHNELLASMKSVLFEEIKKEISETEFCSIQTDALPYEDNKFSVIVRYTHSGCIKERFVGFFTIHETFDLAQIINTIIGDARKLVCHSHDGSVTMKLIRQKIKNIIPKIIFVHNYKHKLNMLILQGLQNIKECKVFTRQIGFICNFFKVPKRAARLKREGVILTPFSETLWQFHSKAITTIIKNYGKILQVVKNLMMDRNTTNFDTISSACCVLNILKNHSFVLYSCLFNKLFVYADHLANVIQRKLNVYVDTCIQEITQTIKNISNFKTDIIIRHCVDEAKTHLKIKNIPPEIIPEFKKVAFSIIDGVVELIEERYVDTKFLKFVELVDGSRFVNYKNKFPKSLLVEFNDNFLDTFDNQRLENELSMIYSDSLKRFEPYQLFCYLYDNDLSELYKETFKLLRLYLTYPLTPANTGRTCSSLTKVRNYLNESEEGKRDKSVLLYASEYPNDTSDYVRFKEKVMDHFDNLRKTTA